MERKTFPPPHRGKLAILFFVLALSNLGVDDSGWMIVYEAGCEECENLQEEITFSPEHLDLLENESKTTTATFSGGPANWSLPGGGGPQDWYSLSFDSSNTGVSTTTIRAQAGSRIRVDNEFPGKQTWVTTPVTADPVDTLVAQTKRYLTIYGLGSSLNAPKYFPIVEGETRTIRVAINNAPPSSTWKFQVTLSPRTSKMINVENLEKTGNQSAAITLRALDLSGCNKTGFCTKFGEMNIGAERESDKHEVRAAVCLEVYYRD